MIKLTTNDVIRISRQSSPYQAGEVLKCPINRPSAQFITTGSDDDFMPDFELVAVCVDDAERGPRLAWSVKCELIIDRLI